MPLNEGKNPAGFFPYDFRGEYNFTPDLLGGAEHLMAYYGIENTAPADCCTPCDCHCDVFSEHFQPRTGATDPQDVTKDRSNLKVWTHSGGSYSLVPHVFGGFGGSLSQLNGLVTSNELELVCEYQALRYNNFSLAFSCDFGANIPGQKLEVFWNNGADKLIWEILPYEKANSTTGSIPYGGIYWTFPGIINAFIRTPDSPKTIITDWRSDGPPTLFGTPIRSSKVINITPGYKRIYNVGWSGTSSATGGGITKDSYQALSSGKFGFRTIGLQSSFTMNYIRLTENYVAEHRPNCQYSYGDLERYNPDPFYGDYGPNRFTVAGSFAGYAGGAGAFSFECEVNNPRVTDFGENWIWHAEIDRPAGAAEPDGDPLGADKWDVYLKIPGLLEIQPFPFGSTFQLIGPTVVVDFHGSIIPGIPFGLEYNYFGNILYRSPPEDIVSRPRFWSSIAFNRPTSAEVIMSGSTPSGLGLTTCLVTAVHP